MATASTGPMKRTVTFGAAGRVASTPPPDRGLGRAVRLRRRRLEPGRRSHGRTAERPRRFRGGNRHPDVCAEPRVVIDALRIPRRGPRRAVARRAGALEASFLPPADSRRLFLGRHTRLRRPRLGTARDLRGGDQPRLLPRPRDPQAALPGTARWRAGREPARPSASRPAPDSTLSVPVVFRETRSGLRATSTRRFPKVPSARLAWLPKSAMGSPCPGTGSRSSSSVPPRSRGGEKEPAAVPRRPAAGPPARRSAAFGGGGQDMMGRHP